MAFFAELQGISSAELSHYTQSLSGQLTPEQDFEARSAARWLTRQDGEDADFNWC